MQLKTDEHGNAVLQDGKPVYVREDKTEIAFDAPGTVATITRLNGEAKSHREAKEAAEARLKVFDGIEDPAKAREALEMLSKIDQKKLIDAGQVDAVKAEAQRAFEEKLRGIEEKYKPVVVERDRLQTEIVAEKVGGAFERSKFIADKLMIPADMVRATFGGSFKLEDGNVVAYGKDGNKIFSPARPGEVATFDEALEVMVNAYPHKDSILKGSGANGGGAHGGGGAGAFGKTLSRAAFDALQPAKRMEHIKAGGAVTD